MKFTTLSGRLCRKKYVGLAFSQFASSFVYFPQVNVSWFTKEENILFQSVICELGSLIGHLDLTDSTFLKVFFQTIILIR